MRKERGNFVTHPHDRTSPVIAKPKFRLKNPDRTLEAEQFELLAITSEDLRFLAMLVEDDVIENAPAARFVSTTLRRLLVQGDLGRAARLAGWTEPFAVRTRMLDYDNPHPRVIVTCGGGKWGQHRMPDSSSDFGGEGMDPPPHEWSRRDNVEIDLNKYLDTLSFAIFGTGVKRSDIINYVANKKAAHVSDTRGTPALQVLDHVWHGMFHTRVNSEGHAETLNTVYIELFGIVVALVESPSVQRFADWLLEWLSTYKFEFGPEVAKKYAIEFPITPLDTTEDEPI